MADFGAKFRKARKARGLDIDRVAAETRISTRFLTAIEKEEFHLLPGGVFNRGFIRSYAEHIGLDPNEVLSDYDRLAHDQEPDLSELRTSAPRRERSGLKLYPVAAGVLLLVLIVIVYVLTRDAAIPVTAGEPPVVQQPVSTLPSAAPPVAPGSAPEPEPIVDALRLEMTVTEATWIRLATDGIPVLDGIILQPGSTHRYSAQSSIDLTIGNAAGLTLRLNEREIRTLGRSGQVREFTITPENVDDFAGD